MKLLFSQRYSKTLDQLYKDKELNLPLNLRVRIIKTLEDYCEYSFSNEITSEAAENSLKKLLGVDILLAFDEDNDRVSANIWNVIRNGYPHEALDAIESFFIVLSVESKSACQEEINQAFITFNRSWRLIDGLFFRVDSGYLADEVITQASELLNQHIFTGPHEEFQQAREAYSRGEIKECISKANNALESTIKAILGLKTGRPKQLVEKLIKSGIIPSYYEGFFNAFNEILMIVPIQRMQPGAAHGQGETTVNFSDSFGELTLHITGSLIVFLMKRYSESKTKELERSLTKK